MIKKNAAKIQELKELKELNSQLGIAYKREDSAAKVHENAAAAKAAAGKAMADAQAAEAKAAAEEEDEGMEEQMGMKSRGRKPKNPWATKRNEQGEDEEGLKLHQIPTQ